MEKKKNKGKHLAFLLRHDTSYPYKEDGWREVSDLVKNHGFTREELETLVKTDEKGRYEFDMEKRRIRAVQGHSIPGVKPDSIVLTTPPTILYHGTSSKYISSIMSGGLEKRNRNHVHLSEDPDTARKVGARHGGGFPVIIHVKARKFFDDGHKIFKSANGVWLTEDSIPYKDYCFLLPDTLTLGTLSCENCTAAKYCRKEHCQANTSFCDVPVYYNDLENQSNL